MIVLNYFKSQRNYQNRMHGFVINVKLKERQKKELKYIILLNI
jgi:hypothetical protein